MKEREKRLSMRRETLCVLENPALSEIKAGAGTTPKGWSPLCVNPPTESPR